MESLLRRSTAADADHHRLVWLERPADLHTPVRLFLALREAGHRLCLLESAEGPDHIGRYSFLGVNPEARLTAGPEQACLERDGHKETLLGSPQQTLEEAAGRHRLPAPPAGLPPFVGGWVGYFPYEWVTALESRVPAAAKDPWQLPMAEFHLYRTVLAFDQATRRLVLMSACDGGAAEHGAAMARLEALSAEVEEIQPRPGSFRLLGEGPRSNTTQEAFEAGVETLRGHIAEGDIFQGVLSQRFEQEFAGDAFALYRALRLTNPSPHMFYFEGADITLVGSSPERLVAVRGDEVENRPIAGTRARGRDLAEDERLGAELLADPKERAEHAMLVDLARNDLGRIARLDTVTVRESMSLEKFAQVQHLVSRVTCRLAAGQGPLDALAACFPAGTVSGAPKIRAMELLASLEPDTRGPYAGAFGYLDGNGNLDMALTIRTFVIRGQTVSVQAGAGIVYDSRPEREYQETLEKADALFRALRLAHASLGGSAAATTTIPGVPS